MECKEKRDRKLGPCPRTRMECKNNSSRAVGDGFAASPCPGRIRKCLWRGPRAFQPLPHPRAAGGGLRPVPPHSPLSPSSPKTTLKETLKQERAPVPGWKRRRASPLTLGRPHNRTEDATAPFSFLRPWNGDFLQFSAILGMCPPIHGVRASADGFIAWKRGFCGFISWGSSGSSSSCLGRAAGQMQRELKSL